MRSLILPLILALPFFTLAQVEQDENPYIQVSNGEFSFEAVNSGGKVPVYQIDVLLVEADELQESLYDFFRRNSDLKPIKVENEILVPGVEVEKVRKKPFDLYTHVQETRDGARVYLAVKDTADFMKPDDPDYGLAMERVVKMRINEVVIDALENKLKKEERLLDDLEDELKDIRNEIDDNQKDIRKNDQRIIENKQKISALQAQSEQLLSALTEQRTNLAKAQTKEEKKSIKKSVKSLEKEIRRANKEIEDLTEDNYDMEAEIRDWKYEIAKFEEQRDTQAAKIQAQMDKVQEVENEIDGIKRLM